MAGRAVLRILYGPPGTGKTYQAARQAVEIIDGTFPLNEIAFQQRHRTLVEMGRIIWVTFHPSYSYEDFVEGFRPSLSPGGSLVYTPEKGPFRTACDNCKDIPPLARVRVGDQIRSAQPHLFFEVTHVDPYGAALQSQVTRSNAIAPQGVQYVDLWTIDRFRAAGIAPNALSPSGQNNPGRQAVAQASGIPSTAMTNAARYRALWTHLDALATSNQPEAVVLVIDEINRADLSRVFGELLTLLELDKRQGAPEERSVILPYSKDRFSVPATLSVIGTMNTADRSLAVIDVALRRRFEFEEVVPEPALCPANYGGVNVAEALVRWNRRITALLSRDFRLGHAELLESKVEQVREAQGWPDDDDGRRRALAGVLRRKIVPLFDEYFHDDWRKAEFVLGDSGILEEIRFQDVQKRAAGRIDLSDQSSFDVAGWSDPFGPVWDGSRLADALNEVQRAKTSATLPGPGTTPRVPSQRQQLRKSRIRPVRHSTPS